MTHREYLLKYLIEGGIDFATEGTDILVWISETEVRFGFNSVGQAYQPQIKAPTHSKNPPTLEDLGLSCD